MSNQLPNAAEPQRDCALCPRLAAFRKDNRDRFPQWHNAPVPAFGAQPAKLVIVGLAPGLRGANRTGRAFTGDGAGDVLYALLQKLGLARGDYKRSGDPDTLRLTNCRIVNAVRCVPPENRPTPSEIATCRTFLKAELEACQMNVVLALGQVAHRAVLDVYQIKPYNRFPFQHARQHRINDSLSLIDSYHCSRRNTARGLLTTAMLEQVFTRAIEKSHATS